MGIFSHRCRSPRIRPRQQAVYRHQIESPLHCFSLWDRSDNMPCRNVSVCSDPRREQLFEPYFFRSSFSVRGKGRVINSDYWRFLTVVKRKKIMCIRCFLRGLPFLFFPVFLLFLLFFPFLFFLHGFSPPLLRSNRSIKSSQNI